MFIPPKKTILDKLRDLFDPWSRLKHYNTKNSNEKEVKNVKRNQKKKP